MRAPHGLGAVQNLTSLGAQAPGVLRPHRLAVNQPTALQPTQKPADLRKMLDLQAAAHHRGAGLRMAGQKTQRRDRQPREPMIGVVDCVVPNGKDVGSTSRTPGGGQHGGLPRLRTHAAAS